MNATSYCTYEQLKAYRSMEAFNFLVNGRVTNIVVVSCHRPKVFILMALVKHSQRLTVLAVKVWVATTGLVEALSGWSGNKPGFDSGIVMSVRSTMSDCVAKHAPLGGMLAWTPPKKISNF